MKLVHLTYVFALIIWLALTWMIRNDPVRMPTDITLNEVPKCPSPQNPRHERLINEACPRRDKKLAIAMPFYELQIDHVIRALRYWENENSTFPCYEGDLGYQRIDLVLSYQGEPNPRIEERINQEWFQNSTAKGCFHFVRYLPLNYPQSGHHDGSRAHFREMFASLSQMGYDFMFLMEADTYPVRKNWLMKVWEESMCGDQFWMKGAHFIGLSRQHNIHINGNAIYNLQDETFTEHLKKALSDKHDLPYDLAVSIYFWETTDDHILHLTLWNYRFSSFIASVGTIGQYDISHPILKEAHLIHGMRVKGI